MTDPISLCVDSGHHDAAIEALYARNFGPGRFAKAAARLREGNACLHDYSFLAFQGQEVVGACRLWPVKTEEGTSALFLGPIAVDRTLRRAGLGQQLVMACLNAVDAAGDRGAVILVGDQSYFGKMGFQIVPKGVVTLPSPVDPARLLWRTQNVGTPPQGRLSVPRATSQTN